MGKLFVITAVTVVITRYGAILIYRACKISRKVIVIVIWRNDHLRFSIDSTACYVVLNRKKVEFQKIHTEGGIPATHVLCARISRSRTSKGNDRQLRDHLQQYILLVQIQLHVADLARQIAGRMEECQYTNVHALSASLILYSQYLQECVRAQHLRFDWLYSLLPYCIMLISERSPQLPTKVLSGGGNQEEECLPPLLGAGHPFRPLSHKHQPEIL